MSIITGTPANDNLISTNGNDTIDGGDGIDSVSYLNATSGVTANLATGLASGGGGNDTLLNIENIIGSNYADLLIGDANDNVFWGRGGNDTMDGGDGVDYVSYFYSPSAVTVNLALGTATGGEGNDTLLNIEKVTGSNYADTLIGDAGDNVFQGRNGDDTIDGGAGNDWVSYSVSTAAVNVNLATGKATGGAGNDTLLNIEYVEGSNYSDTLTGNSGNNTFHGLKGDDTIDGGAGTDAVSYVYSTSAVTVNLVSGTATGGEDNDTLLNIENIGGSRFSDTLIGNSGNNSLWGREGDDTIDGGAGTDTIDYSNSQAAVTVNLAAGTASGGEGNDTLLNIENIYGSKYDDTLIGSLGNNVINGNDGFDTVDYNNSPSSITVNLALGTATGGEGNDTLKNIEYVIASNYNDILTGDAGNNYFDGLSGNDTIDGGAGIDTVSYFNSPSSVTVNLASGMASGGQGNDTLIGLENIFASNFNDVLTGDAGDNKFTGEGGNDVIRGGAGFDTAVFSDTLSHYALTKVGSTYIIRDKTGIEGTDTATQVELLEFTDMSVNLQVQGIAAAAPLANVQRISELYVAFFNRTPDADGMAYWISQNAAGQSINQISESFYSIGASPAFASLTGFSTSMSDKDFIDVFYKNVLGRPEGADAGGLAYWNGKLADGTSTRSSLANDILSSAHSFKGNPAWGWVADLLDNKIAVANTIAIQWGLNYYTDAYTHGVTIAAAITPANISAALALVGISATDMSLV